MDDRNLLTIVSQERKDLIRFLFSKKAATLENKGDASGMFSTQRKIVETGTRLVGVLDKPTLSDSFFYIFAGDAILESLIIVCNNVTNYTEKTNHVAICINQTWTDFKVLQLTLSGKMLTYLQQSK